MVSGVEWLWNCFTVERGARLVTGDVGADALGQTVLVLWAAA